MKYQIGNDKLMVEIEDLGAQLSSIRSSEGTEYLWQGNPKYWSDRAINLFPYIGRMTGGQYILDGQIYQMGLHGFAKDTIFEAEQKSNSHIVFHMQNTETTYSQYPYAFRFDIDYRLEGNKLITTYYVKNHNEKDMYFAIGGHPGFNVPFDDNSEFEDYYLEFDYASDVQRVYFSDDGFVTGMEEFALKNGRQLELRHEIFDHDAIVLKGVAKRVALKSHKSKKVIYVSYPNMTYVGFWQCSNTDAPYVCVEPWSSLPSRKGIVEDLKTQPGLILLKAGEEYYNGFDIEVIESPRENI